MQCDSDADGASSELSGYFNQMILLFMILTVFINYTLNVRTVLLLTVTVASESTRTYPILSLRAASANRKDGVYPFFKLFKLGRRVARNPL